MDIIFLNRMYNYYYTHVCLKRVQLDLLTEFLPYLGKRQKCYISLLYTLYTYHCIIPIQLYRMYYFMIHEIRQKV